MNEFDALLEMLEAGEIDQDEYNDRYDRLYEQRCESQEAARTTESDYPWDEEG